MADIDCPICDAGASETLPRSGDYIEVTCLHCGHYRITETAATSIENRPVDERRGMLKQAEDDATGKAVPIIGGVWRP